jgi:flagella basal body P-ring formation protein FlgA
MTGKLLLLAGMLLATAHLAAAETLIARHTIRSRAVLSEDDIDVVPEWIAGALSNPDDAVGLEARVVLYSGRPIRAEDLQPPALVERNQIVTLVYQKNGLSILTEGRSLARASQGERIRAMNLASRSTVTGTVTSSGQVVVGPPGSTSFLTEPE